MARSYQKAFADSSSVPQHPSMDDLGHLESPNPEEKVFPWLGRVERRFEEEEEEGRGELRFPFLSSKLVEVN